MMLTVVAIVYDAGDRDENAQHDNAYESGNGGFPWCVAPYQGVLGFTPCL